MATITHVQDVPENEFAKHSLTKGVLRQMLQKMLLLRKFEEKVEALFLVKGLLIGPSHLYLGQEAIAVGAMMAMQPADLIVTTYRGHGHRWLRMFLLSFAWPNCSGSQRGIAEV